MGVGVVKRGGAVMKEAEKECIKVLTIYSVTMEKKSEAGSKKQMN